SLSNGSSNRGSADGASASQTNVGYHTRGAGMQYGPSPIDAAAEFVALGSLSPQLTTLSGHGRRTRKACNAATLTGTDAQLNVFDVDATFLQGLRMLDNVVPTTLTVLVNVSGQSLAMQYMGIHVNGQQDNSLSSRMLWNFHELMS